MAALGARVIACASPSKLNVARTAGGADFAVDYTKEGWQKEVLKITGGRGVDVVYDPVGRIRGMSCSPIEQTPTDVTPTDSLKCIAWSGRAIVVGFAGGEIEKVRDAPCELGTESHLIDVNSFHLIWYSSRTYLSSVYSGGLIRVRTSLPSSFLLKLNVVFYST